MDVGNAVRRKPILLVVVAIASCALIGGAAVAGASKAEKKTAIFDLFGGKLVKPEQIFLTANSGPYLTDLEWFKWGKDKTTGVGTFVSDCASCPGPDRRPAIVRLSKRDECKKKGGFCLQARPPDDGRRRQRRGEDDRARDGVRRLLQARRLSPHRLRRIRKTVRKCS